MYGVEHLKYWGVTEDFADSKWCYAFNNFLWIHALKCKNFRGVLWRVRGLKFDLPSEQSLLNASDLCSFHSSCSQGVMFWMWQACSAANPLAAGTESWATFRMPGRSSNLSLCLPLWLPEWTDWALISAGYSPLGFQWVEFLWDPQELAFLLSSFFCWN